MLCMGYEPMVSGRQIDPLDFVGHLGNVNYYVSRIKGLNISITNEDDVLDQSLGTFEK